MHIDPERKRTLQHHVVITPLALRLLLRSQRRRPPHGQGACHLPLCCCAAGGGSGVSHPALVASPVGKRQLQPAAVMDADKLPMRSTRAGSLHPGLKRSSHASMGCKHIGAAGGRLLRRQRSAPHPQAALQLQPATEFARRACRPRQRLPVAEGARAALRVALLLNTQGLRLEVLQVGCVRRCPPPPRLQHTRLLHLQTLPRKERGERVKALRALAFACGLHLPS